MNNYLAVEIKPNIKGTLKEFIETFRLEYLKKFGLVNYELRYVLPGRDSCLFTVRTVHGEVVVSLNDILIYKGHNSWEIKHNGNY